MRSKLDNALILSHFRRFALFKALAISKFYSPAKNRGSATAYATFWGKSMNGIVGEVVSENIRTTGFFEQNLCEALIHLLNPGMTFVDIGAHIGFHSLLASQLVHKSGKVIAVEPSRETFKILKDNCKDNNNIIPVEAAAWSSDKVKLLNVYTPELSAFNSFFEPRLPARITVKRIPRATYVVSRSIDSLMKEYELAPDFIKIDAESSESEIIKGMAETLGRYKPILSIEVGDHQLPNVCTSASLLKQLADFHYLPFEVRNRMFIEHKPKEHYTYDNLLFIHQSRRSSLIGS